VTPTITDRDFTIATIAAPAAVVSADNEAKAGEKAEASSSEKED
jgi:large subunit ribosomal protein L25